MRLLAAMTLCALFLLAACGDDDSNDSPAATSSPTPTEAAVASGQATPNEDACTRDDVRGTFVSSDNTAGHIVLTLEVGRAERACTLLGRPELRWYGADGKGLGVPFTPNDDCGADDTDYKTCVYTDPIDLSPTSGSGAVTAVRAVVSIANIGVLEPCASPSKQARRVGLQFPDVPQDVQITLPDVIELQTCVAQVELAGYGPE